MPSVLDKLDRGLVTIYANFLRLRERGAADAGNLHRAVAEGLPIHVLVRVSGSLEAAEAAGFKTVWSDDSGRATGSLRLDDLERIAACPEILSISYGDEHLPALDRSVPDIRADKVWTLAQGAFAGRTGKGALVGIIDTGIDYRHTFFSADATLKTTRILRIWDQGLQPTGGERSPDKALLHPGTPGAYGVEYTDGDINKVLQGAAGATVRHRDCRAHGTHVASIAAGNGRPGLKFIGVAPEAGIIVVKFMSLQAFPKVNGNDVAEVQRFMDAVMYCRNVADKIGKPIAINLSGGTDLGAHDGQGAFEDFLADAFDDSKSAGKVFVAAAGNAAGNRQHGRVGFAAAGTVEIPFELFDNRTSKVEFDRCEKEDSTRILAIDCYYARDGTTLSAEFRAEGEAGFTTGPVIGAQPVPNKFAGREFTIVHNADVVPQTGGGSADRNHVFVLVEHSKTNGHLTGTYVLRLTADGPLSVHVWASQFHGADGHGFRFATAQPAAVTVEDRFLVGAPAGARNVLAVAAYDAEVPTLDVAFFSSRGPLAQYGAGGTPPPKPDLAAPGVGIDAAKSRDLRPAKPGDTISFRGTSMATPHVTGAAALVLDKNPGLVPSKMFAALHLGARPPSGLPTEDLGFGRLDANDAVLVTP